MPALRLILGDQLSHKLSALEGVSGGDLVLMAEVSETCLEINHHKKKLAFMFSSMRHFADELMNKGINVEYIHCEDSDNFENVLDVISWCLDKNRFNEIIMTEPGNFQVLSSIKDVARKYKIKLYILADTRFISDQDEFSNWAKGRKSLVMENWYRLMRKKTGLLMDGSKPVGGKWNFDKENRNPLKPGTSMKAPRKFRPDKITQNVLETIETRFSNNFGAAYPFWFAVTATQAGKALEHFISHHLQFFGDYQDAMLDGEAFLNHSVISHYINCGLLDPLEVCVKVEQAYYRNEAPLNAVEGFIRQIIGWREYIRGIYWLYMPDYKEMNYLEAKRPLPDFYWTGDTKMNCIANVVNMTRKHAYSHHIQRLMVTGNFANLAGINVQAVSDWYLGVYADAHEWVELPNTLGMALFADGGIIGTKPYISTGSYIKRMSNYCDDCIYDPGKRVGDTACPFTTLYWEYLIHHEDKLRENHRMAFSYKNLDRLSNSEKRQIRAHARIILESI
ncbi:MAG: cryptochrome/photolyase family protein [Gammaproteobacteria bacterium]|nr:cryptochrome/photolyase family protein [Gammaproteobacteria bacterium]